MSERDSNVDPVGPTAAVDPDDTVPYQATGPGPSKVGAGELGVTFGRYVVLATVGSGGMGVVFAAYDPTLDRKVAIKMLHLDGHEPGDESRLRLEREARAMARLSHPNVITVYEVGRVGANDFLAMELVEGTTLRAWQTAEARSWRDLLATYLEAARGLIAAHDAGLVHRDFKPENVLIGRDGRARVGDFGLVSARMTDDAGELDAPTDRGLTVRGTWVGTPAYMAPEQWLGGEVDARSDQFSFCVALWEALHGQRPFAGARAAEVRAAVLAGERRPPTKSEAPAWLTTALTRGLERDPARRWPSLAALVEELSRRGASRTRWWAAAGLAAATSAAVAVVATRPDAVDPCARAGDAVGATWTSARAAALRSSLERTGKPYAGSVAARVLAELDRYTGAWRVAAIDTCKATHVHHQQSAELLDRRGACLEARRREVDALVTALTTSVDGTALESATRAAYALGPIDACADRELLLAAVAPPPPAARAATDALAVRLEEARAQHRLGHYDLARTQVDPVVREALAAGYPALTADALHVQGQVRRDLGDLPGAVASFHQAATEAARAHRDELVATIQIDLLEVVDDRQQQLDTADALLPLVRAAVARAGDRPTLRASFAIVEGLTLGNRSKFEEERVHLVEAVRLYEAALGPRSVELATALSRLANTDTELRRYDDARAANERAAEIIRALFGDDHPRMGVVLSNLGWVALEANQLEDAGRFLERALAIQEASLGDHQLIAKTLGNLANLRSMQDRPAEAVPLYHRTLDIIARLDGKQHPSYGRNLGNFGGTLAMLGRFDEARVAMLEALELKLAAYGEAHASTAYSLEFLASIELTDGNVDAALAYQRRALAARRATLGEHHQMTGMTWFGLAEIQADAGRCGAALEGFSHATSIVGKAVGEDSADLAKPLYSHARCLQRLGRSREALPLAERALAIATATEVEPKVAALARFVAGSLRWELGIGSRAEQRALVSRAAEELRALGPVAVDSAATAEAWLASHR